MGKSQTIDVDTIPENGTWFQLIQNGTTVINDGPNGLQKLDKVMELAQKHGLYILLSLTNNWNPRPLTDSINITDPLSVFRLGRRDVTPGTNNSFPRGTLSNDYGAITVRVPSTSLNQLLRWYGPLRPTVWRSPGARSVLHKSNPDQCLQELYHSDCHSLC